MASRTVGAIPAKAQPDEKITDEMRAKFRELSKKNYIDQAKWYLNGFWTHGAEQQAEEVWNTVQTFIKMDKRKKEGNELNEVEAHHFLQSSGKTMTALELRNALRKIDIDANGMMGVLEYVLFQYNRRVGDCLNNPQGGSEETKKLEEAQAQLDAMNAALADLQVQLEQQRESEAKAKAAEEALTRAEEEARAASAEFQRQEDEYKSKIAALEAKSTDSSIGTVSRNKAVQELAQLKGEDPLPLRRAKITQEAAVRKVAAERKVAEAARVKAEEQTKVVEAAVADTEAKAAATTALLEELKRAAAVPFGAIWWMQREVTEAKKYMPKSRQ